MKNYLVSITMLFILGIIALGVMMPMIQYISTELSASIAVVIALTWWMICEKHCETMKEIENLRKEIERLNKEKK